MNFRTILCLACAAAAVAAVPSSATIAKYHDSYLPAFATADSGWNYWETNRLWRPAGNLADLWFSNQYGDFLGYDASYVNPFTIYGPYGYSRSWCGNAEAYLVSPFTCQAYTYRA